MLEQEQKFVAHLKIVARIFMSCTASNCTYHVPIEIGILDALIHSIEMRKQT
jgi:hypothetical protein